MAVMNDYKCDVHGYFEAREPKCPHGCDTVQLVFLQPVGYKSDRTKGADKTMSQLAMDFGMTDIKSVKQGEAQPKRFEDTRKKLENMTNEIQGKQQQQNPFAVQWQKPSAISGYNTRSINGENVNGLSAVKSSANLSGPRTASYIADHQNLQIDKGAK